MSDLVGGSELGRDDLLVLITSVPHMDVVQGSPFSLFDEKVLVIDAGAAHTCVVHTEDEMSLVWSCFRLL